MERQIKEAQQMGKGVSWDKQKRGRRKKMSTGNAGAEEGDRFRAEMVRCGGGVVGGCAAVVGEPIRLEEEEEEGGGGGGGGAQRGP